MTTEHTAEDTAAQTTTPGTRRPLTAVITAYVISVTCTAVSALAIPWLVLTSTGSPTRTGAIVFAQMAPYVIMQAVAGPWVERFGPRRACWSANLASGLVLAAVPLLHWLAGLETWMLAALVAVVGALRGVADNGGAVLVPATARVAGTPLERAAGLHASAVNAGFLLGAPLAGVLLTLMAPPLVLAVSAAGFALTGLLVVSMVAPGTADHERSEGEDAGYLTRLAAGLRFIAADRLLLGLVVMIAATNLLATALNGVMLPAWVQDRDLPVASLGVVAGCLGAGTLVGSLLGAWLAPRLPRWPTYSLAFLLWGAPFFFVLALSDAVLRVGVVAVLCGLAAGFINPIVGAVQYERIPPGMLARTMGAVKASAWVGVPLGPLVGGVVTETLGVTAALLAFGSVFLVLTLGPFVLPVFRQLDERPAPVGEVAERA